MKLISQKQWKNTIIVLYLALNEQKRREHSCPRREEGDAIKFPEV
jgi:hypothetical protein